MVQSNRRGGEAVPELNHGNKQEKAAAEREANTGNSTAWNTKLDNLLGFTQSDLGSWHRFITLLHRPADPSSLAFVRIMFGAMMMMDVVAERGLPDADLRWGDISECRFPLIDWLKPLPLEWMCLIYLIMWIGAAGITIGAWFRLSCFAFVVPYWYLFLLDKSTWNNHSYLYGLLGTFFLTSSAHHGWSVDGLLGRVQPNSHIPLWNYTILRFQLFVLYFVAGLKKLDQDWLSGYSMSTLSYHWVFTPLTAVLTPGQVDFWIVHMFGFVLDLTIGFWLLLKPTRPLALLVLSSFHLMNATIFHIGMFPYVCLVTQPVFCHPDWPRKLMAKWWSVKTNNSLQRNENCIYAKTAIDGGNDSRHHLTWRHYLTAVLLLSHVGLQAFLPYSHFLTKGYNSWTNGLYGYSWDMMVHTWQTVLVVVKVTNRDTGEEHFLDPEAWTQNDRWQKHTDMIVQYARCVRDNVQRERPEMSNLSVHIDVWSSLNRRFQQRMYDPQVELSAGGDWSPFHTVPWTMPLLSHLTPWRETISALQSHVHSWANNSDALFVADFPGLHLENYIHGDLTNISLSVLVGEVMVEVEGRHNCSLRVGGSADIPPATFHKVHTVSPGPACYMYTYHNLSYNPAEENIAGHKAEWEGVPWDDAMRAVSIVSNAILKVLYNVPMVRRVKLRGEPLASIE